MEMKKDKHLVAFFVWKTEVLYVFGYVLTWLLFLPLIFTVSRIVYGLVFDKRISSSGRGKKNEFKKK